MKIDIQKANNELQINTYEQIQEQTAWNWASRAAAAYLRSINSTKVDQKLTWFETATIEHASINPNLVQEVIKELNNYKVKCKDSIKKWKQGEV